MTINHQHHNTAANTQSIQTTVFPSPFFTVMNIMVYERIPTRVGMHPRNIQVNNQLFFHQLFLFFPSFSTAKKVTLRKLKRPAQGVVSSVLRKGTASNDTTAHQGKLSESKKWQYSHYTVCGKCAIPEMCHLPRVRTPTGKYLGEKSRHVGMWTKSKKVFLEGFHGSVFSEW